MPPLLVSVHKESFDFFFLFEIYICCPEKMQIPHPCKVKASLDGALTNMWKMSLPMAGVGTKWCLRSLPFVDVFQKYLPCKLPKVLNQAFWQYMIPIARTEELPPTSGNTAPSALIHHIRNPAVLLKHLWCAANSLVWNKKIHYA